MYKKTILITLALVLIAGCGGRNQRASLTSGRAMKMAYGAAMPQEAMAYDMEMAEASVTTMGRQMSDTGSMSSRVREEDGALTTDELNAVERKLVKRAYIRIRVENLDTADSSVADLLQKYDAYAASTDVGENYRNYSLRVPAPHYDAFLAAVNGMGRLLNRSENTEDVTLRYYDLEGRLETKKELLRTFQSYLGKAKTIEEILAVEARISELQYDIEGTGVQLRNLANRVDYATIDLNLSGPVTSVPRQNATLGERIKELFGSFGGFLGGVAVVILGIVVYGIPVLLLVVFFFWLLLGRVGLLKKLWRLVRGKRQHAVDG